MLRLTRHTYLAVLSAFALLTQLFAPSLAMAGEAGPSFICNPATQVSQEMQAGIDVLKAALGVETPETTAMDCEDCVASVHIISMASFHLLVPATWAWSSSDLISQDVFLANPRGPPLGSRAPPFPSVI